MNKVGSRQEDSKIYAILTIEKTKDNARHICHIGLKKRGSDVSRLTEKDNRTK